MIVVLPGNVSVTASPPVSFHTTFPGTENPISESGSWQKLCTWFTTVQTGSGYAWGNQPTPQNPGIYQDSYALLSSSVGVFPPNQKTQAIIKKLTTGGYEEYELRLRCFDNANACGGYEVFIHQSGLYLTVASWAGTTLSAPATIAYFDIIQQADNVTAPQDGDLFEAQIVGNIITAKLQGVTLLTCDVSQGGRTPWASGQPGIGFDAGGSGAETPNLNYGFNEFWAYGL